MWRFLRSSALLAYAAVQSVLRRKSSREKYRCTNCGKQILQLVLCSNEGCVGDAFLRMNSEKAFAEIYLGRRGTPRRARTLCRYCAAINNGLCFHCELNRR